MTVASQKVRTFLEQRSKMRGLDPDRIHAANGVDRTVSDLEELCTEAESYEILIDQSEEG